MDLSAFTNDPVGWLNLTIQVLLPIIVGLVTTRVTAPGVKAVLLLALTGVNQFVTEALRAADGSDIFDWRTALWGLVIGFGISVISHFGLLKPTNATGSGSWAESSGVKARTNPYPLR